MSSVQSTSPRIADRCEANFRTSWRPAAGSEAQPSAQAGLGCCAFAGHLRGVTRRHHRACFAGRAHRPLPHETFPSERIFKSRVVCAACWFQTGDGVTRLKARSTYSRDVPSLTINVGVPIKPWSSPPHRSRATSRDFVHWCFSYACRQRVRKGSSCRRPKTFTGTVIGERYSSGTGLFGCHTFRDAAEPAEIRASPTAPKPHVSKHPQSSKVSQAMLRS